MTSTEVAIDNHSNHGSDQSTWNMCGSFIRKTQIIFFAQIILIYIVCITSIVQLTRGQDKELWVALLASSLGYILPAPKIHKNVLK